MKSDRPRAKIPMDVGLRVILIYKIVRVATAWSACVLLLVLLKNGKMDQMRASAEVLRDHMTNAVSLGLAKLAVAALTVPGFHRAILALFIDGTFTFFEAWALQRRYWWGPWLILIGTAAFLPFEIVFLARGIKVGRLVVFAINVVIFVYLARRTWREHRIRNSNALE